MCCIHDVVIEDEVSDSRIQCELLVFTSFGDKVRATSTREKVKGRISCNISGKRTFTRNGYEKGSIPRVYACSSVIKPFETDRKQQGYHPVSESLLGVARILAERLVTVSKCTAWGSRMPKSACYDKTPNRR